MADDEVRHPVIVDTDALIAVANTHLWSRLTTTLNVTTTNVCVHELERHVREHSEYAPEGTRERWIHHGSSKALAPFNDAENESFTVVPCVPRPHGEDAGETSVRTEIEQNIDSYRFAILMDKHGRRSLNRVFDDAEETTGKAVAPTFLLYLLLDAEECTVEEFCQACGEMLRGEGWTGYQAIQAAWEAIPVDCSRYLSDGLLP
ncbi:hypothetical protein [Haloarcula nitratireducens]|uniref:PIN domain-containing protein n=1 Tax=Haloarcula nitratireducens TaxID=2487749 RepID=A0AAW4PIW6_9EURY|nr:hypothetical protein [Halomicroarcula nitratireducens]MBX0297230.1 hypothetical protein [Halomicroarcula nitratireducens]